MNTENYTHLAVNKFTNLIVNGWDYSDVEPSELKRLLYCRPQRLRL